MYVSLYLLNNIVLVEQSPANYVSIILIESGFETDSYVKKLATTCVILLLSKCICVIYDILN